MSRFSLLSAYFGVIIFHFISFWVLQLPVRILLPDHSAEFPSIRNCRCVKSLESDITKVDAEYDKCQEAWANGEVENFTGDKLLG